MKRWDLDYYLHENPELKTAPFCFLTDFVGWLPMPEGGEHEARLTADYNAEMIEQIARFPRVRDKAIFVGNPRRHRPGPLRRRTTLDQAMGRRALRVLRIRASARRRPGRSRRRSSTA